MIQTLQNERKAESVSVRRAQGTDRSALLEMYLAFEPKGASLGLPPQKDPGPWLESLAEFPNYVALDGERIVGHCVLCNQGHSAEVAVFVHQDYRQCGIGKRLLGAAIQEARERGLRRVWGMTTLDNVPMLRLARSVGFVSGIDPREFYLDLAPLPSSEHTEIVSAT